MKNSNGYGTVVCLDKSGTKRRNPWAVRITTGFEDGKQKTKYLGYYKTQDEAKLALAQFHHENISLDANVITFKQVYQLWKEVKSGNLTDKNIKAYESAFKLTPELHDCKLKDIKYYHLQMAIDNVNREYSSLSKIKSLWNQMYEVAMMNDLCLKNYATMVNIKCQPKVEMNIYTKNQIQTLWQLRNDLIQDRLIDDVLILIYTGMRISEALSINPKEDIHIENEFSYIECHGTKTQSSNRIIPIHPDILQIIKSRLNDRFLISNCNGKMQYRTFMYQYDKFVNKTLEWNHVIHDTRKTFATILYENNVDDSDIKFMMGHSQSGVTYKHYIKHNLNKLQEVINLVNFV